MPTNNARSYREAALTMQPDGPAPRLPQRAEDVQELPLEFLIEGWVPLDSVTIFWGEPGIGKTFVWTQLVADLTRGRPTIFEKDAESPPKRAPANCLFLSKEDAYNRVLKQRFKLAGADLSRVFGFGQEAPEVLDLDLLSPELEQWISEIRPALVVVDALQRFMPPGSDVNKARDVAEVVLKASHIAGKYRTAFLVIHHSNKTSTAESGRQAMAGSGDLYASARSVIAAGDSGERVNGIEQHYILLDKANYTAPQPAILYHITENGVRYDGRSANSFLQFRANWRQAQEERGQRATPKLDEAKAEILDELEAAGDLPAGELKKRIRDNYGTSADTCYRAQKALVAEGKLFSYREGKRDGSRGSQLFFTLDRGKARERNKKRERRP